MEFIELDIVGCYLIKPKVFNDERGQFVKTLHHDHFEAHGIGPDFKEEYFSVSKKGVLRGMHFQLPPHEHSKLVYCISGKVEDAFIDLRKQSPTFMKSQKLILDSNSYQILYLPKGIAHGFNTLTENATMVYKTSTVHNSYSDSGILWNSCVIDWKNKKPVLSDRDRSFQHLRDFESPF